MRKALSVATLIFVLHTSLFGFCKNLNRLVCAEYSNSKLVVVAKLVGTKHIVPRDSRQQDGFLYTLETVRALKGSVGATFRIYEENSSGRAPFAWIKGESYLLFLDWYEDGWGLYGCGNSRPMKKAGYVLRAIDSMKTRKGGIIQGIVTRQPFDSGTETASIDVSGDNGRYTTTTDKFGEFKIHVPAGHYVVRVRREGWKFQMDGIMTYENPDDVRIEDGGGAQVAFEAVTSR